LEADGEITFETLRWALFARDKQRIPDEMPSAWDTSLLRALKSLKNKGHVLIERRRLKDFTEAAIHYPNKTLNRRVRELRLLVLPALARLEAEGRGLGLHYRKEDNEEHTLSLMGRSRRQDIFQDWLSIEAGIRQALSTNGAALLIQLIAKGRSLLTVVEPHQTYPIVVKKSLWSLIIDCERAGMLPQDIPFRLGAFYENVFPAERGKELAFKSLIHSYATIHDKTGAPKLKRDAISLLYENFYQPLLGLGFFRPITKSPVDWMTPQPEEEKALHALFDRHILAPFRFVRLIG